MPVKRKAEIIAWVRQYFADYFHYPIEYFELTLSLRDDLRFDSRSLVDVGRDINKSRFTPVHVTPGQIVDCLTIGDVAELIYNLERNS